MDVVTLYTTVLP